MTAVSEIEDLICESVFSSINDSYLEAEYGHYAPHELETLNIDEEAKLRTVALQIAALHLVKHESSELYDWIRCHQNLTGDQSYNYV